MTHECRSTPLESLTLKDHCEMCGHTTHLEPAFDPSAQPKTLCDQCRIGSAELLADVRASLLARLRECVDYLYSEADDAEDRNNGLIAECEDAIRKATECE